MVRASQSLVRVGLTLVAVAAAATAIPIAFTGNVPADFPDDPSVFTYTDTSIPVRFEAGNIESGWDIVDIRFSYDVDNDVAYFGACAAAPGWLPPSRSPSPHARRPLALC
jgi:hypothetical protein